MYKYRILQLPVAVTFVSPSVARVLTDLGKKEEPCFSSELLKRTQLPKEEKGKTITDCLFHPFVLCNVMK